MMESSSVHMKRALIVDDEPFNLIALEGLLFQLRVHEIDKAFNGEECFLKIVDNLQAVRDQ